ncbi:alanyl-tRNA editing protein AlaX [Candidatus Bathyarchaeota archaeon]|nr:MAG: alanyl-tRNA editing protein AlaX [Candidatus Bathyarchaeota archaeon]
MAENEKTELLYLKNTYLREFKAEIINIEKLDDKIGIVLDKTAFYPVGGGQPSDMGEISSEKGKAYIIHVENKYGKVYHFADKIEGELNEGDVVKGIIDWDRRYRLMRMHTAAHLLSRAVREAVERPLEIVGSAIDVTKARIDFGYEKSIREFFPKIEEIANTIVAEDRPVIIRMMPRKEAEEHIAKFNESLKILPPHIHEVRIVEIKDWHACACGGTHVKSTGEIGEIKLLKRGSKGKGVERIEFTAIQ